MKRYLITFVKIAISTAILAYLAWKAVGPRADGRNVFLEMVHQPKQWELLAAALAASGAAVALTLVRWCYLVRALGVPLPMRDAMRIGFLGYLFNLSPAGIAGGDLVRAVMLGRQWPGNQSKALASVMVDRFIGLYMLFVVAAAGVLLSGCCQSPVDQLRVIGWTVVGMTLIGTLGVGVFLLPGVVSGRLIKAVDRMPKIGPAIASLVEALHQYRSCAPSLLVAAALSVAVQGMFTVSIFLIDQGLPGEELSLMAQFAVYPVSAVAGTIPLTAGPFEASFDYLYGQMHAGSVVSKGLVIALAYRLITVLIAAVGFIYYLSERQSVAGQLGEDDALPLPGAETSAPCNCT